MMTRTIFYICIRGIERWIKYLDPHRESLTGFVQLRNGCFVLVYLTPNGFDCSERSFHFQGGMSHELPTDARPLYLIEVPNATIPFIQPVRSNTSNELLDNFENEYENQGISFVRIEPGDHFFHFQTLRGGYARVYRYESQLMTQEYKAFVMNILDLHFGPTREEVISFLPFLDTTWPHHRKVWKFPAPSQEKKMVQNSKRSALRAPAGRWKVIHFLHDSCFFIVLSLSLVCIGFALEFSSKHPPLDTN